VEATSVEQGREQPFAYLDTAEDVERFTRSIAGVPAIALDTEGASFHRFLDRVYLLQITVSSATAIIDPLPMAAPPGLGALLEDPAVEVIFHDADYDLRLLHQDYGWHVTNIFDTRIAAQLMGLPAFGLAALLDRYFGVRLDKKHQRADWSMRPLSADMLHYAAQDTRYLLELRDRMRDELSNLGRLDWAAEEFARLEGTRWGAEDSAEAFLRVKGARDLTRRELAIFRELVDWRDATARVMDRATFRVMGNDVLFAIARAMPDSREALGTIKGISRGILERRGGDLLDAVRRGRAVPENDLPRFPRPARFQRDPEFEDRVARLRAVRDETAQRLALDPGVLCSRERLEVIARSRATTREELYQLPDLRRWQADQLGQPLLDAMSSARPAAS
jgi:ribonuclease D